MYRIKNKKEIILFLFENNNYYVPSLKFIQEVNFSAIGYRSFIMISGYHPRQIKYFIKIYKKLWKPIIGGIA